MSTEAGRWLSRRVRVWSGADRQRQGEPMAEGVVIGYAAAPTLTVRDPQGHDSHWQTTLPIDVIEEQVPGEELDRINRLHWGQPLVPDDTVPVERLAKWLHGQYGPRMKVWSKESELTRESWRDDARSLRAALPELFR